MEKKKKEDKYYDVYRIDFIDDTYFKYVEEEVGEISLEKDYMTLIERDLDSPIVIYINPEKDEYLITRCSLIKCIHHICLTKTPEKVNIDSEELI